jgi:hypothetical protein
VDFSDIPPGSSLPQLPIPQKAPDSRPLRHLLSTVLFFASQRLDGHISQREILQYLNRASRAPIHEKLFTLRQEGFLTRINRRKDLTDADRYKAGKKLTGVHGQAWHELILNLYGKNGICKDLLGHPAFGTGFLNQNGMLIIGALIHSVIPLSVKNLHSYLSFFIGDENTIRNRLKLAEKHGLVIQNSSTWSIAPRFQKALDKYSREYGPDNRRIRTDLRTQVEREEYAIHLRYGKITQKEQDELRTSGCIRCGKTNQQHIADTGKQLQMEHFPPKKWLKTWGYTDHIDFNWAICSKCNNNYSQYIKRRPAPTLDKFIRTSFVADADISRTVLASLETAIQKFYRHIDGKRYGEASKIALHAFHLWASTIPQNVNSHAKTAVHLLITPLNNPVARRTRRARRTRIANTPASAKSTAKGYANTERIKGSKRR